MPLHYTKSGSLDMRYSSSRAAVSSEYSGGGGGGGSGSSVSSLAAANSGGGGSSSAGLGLHYTRDGSLDMRYSSSKAAVASHGHDYSSGGGGSRYGTSLSTSNSGGGSGSSSAAGSGLHYTRDGSLDMRYSSSKAAAAAGTNGVDAPDMSYGSSKAYVEVPEVSDLHYKRDGTLDMRYSSSKQTVSNVLPGLSKLAISNPGHRSIPSGIPVTKSGLPDMRTKVAKEWVKARAASQGFGSVPDWVPRLKDGSVDAKKSVAVEYLKHSGWSDFQPIPEDLVNRREKYYNEKMLKDYGFQRTVERVRGQDVPMPIPEIRQCYLPESCQIKEHLRIIRYSDSNMEPTANNFPNKNIKEISYSEINLGTTETELGRGAFGVVLKGDYNGKAVAVKRLHLTRLSSKEKKSFLKEILILGWLGEHENLVTLHAYTLTPPSLVMEFVSLGNLSQLLHYSEDMEVEAKISDGRIKYNIILGIVAGMIQLHAVDVVHGDLKPQNILITEHYVAKITDFGLATLRGKTGSSTASQSLTDEEFVIGGTGAYMAPELLTSTTLPELSSDVYSFGILLNEVTQEEEPFSDQFRNFALRGPFAAVNHAKQGHRPNTSGKLGAPLKKLIQNCWAEDPKSRPTFVEILKSFKMNGIQFPNSCS